MTVIIKRTETTLKKVQDAIDIIKKMDKETDMFLFRDDERKIDPEVFQKRIENGYKENIYAIFIAYDKKTPVGYISVSRGIAPRQMHGVEFAIGVLKAYQGQGISKQLMETMINWCREIDIKRIELHVRTNNETAVALYEKFGFKHEGTLKSKDFMDGKYYDQYVMAKFI